MVAACMGCENLQVICKVPYMDGGSYPGSRTFECSEDRRQGGAGLCTWSLTLGWNPEFQVFLRDTPPLALGTTLVFNLESRRAVFTEGESCVICGLRANSLEGHSIRPSQESLKALFTWWEIRNLLEF